MCSWTAIYIRTLLRSPAIFLFYFKSEIPLEFCNYVLGVFPVNYQRPESNKFMFPIPLSNQAFFKEAPTGSSKGIVIKFDLISVVFLMQLFDRFLSGVNHLEEAEPGKVFF
ncbi:hypothetical protein L6452_06021 [Arctium lappa]|uniref:Uncharacterized protein n=1 Tax=Arctium lappa TaxID=4217 RepID=A0ACB9EIP5_ARCLA|nr:hypothetical protein L6452_06021 [Arctium lappa]